MSRWADELETCDWAQIGCGCGRDGTHLPPDIQTFLETPITDLSGRSFADEVIEGHAVIQSTAFASAVPVSRLLSAAVAQSAELGRRMQIYGALLSILCCDAQGPGFNEDWPPLVTTSRAIVERVKDVIYADLAETRSPLLLNLLEYCERDEGRLRGVYDQIRSELPALYQDGYRLFARRDEGW